MSLSEEDRKKHVCGLELQAAFSSYPGSVVRPLLWNMLPGHGAPTRRGYS